MTTSPHRRRPWLVPAGLVLLTLIPAAGGGARLAQLFGGAEVTQENARFFAAPVPVLIHIFSATLFCLLGAFQFAPALRRRSGWHRAAGRVAVPLGLAAALSGLWMSVLYPDAPGDGLPVRVLRLVFGSLMAVSILLGLLAARRRDFPTHRVWMMRGYAVGQGAGTQAFTHLPWMVLVGIPTGNVRAALMAAGWLINVAVVEWVVRRRTRRPAVPVPA
ncbi:DUF2306 domain-containing protein [Catellatospora sp. KI3]|uniref:DUF2306 domain-containing protein n=1 Tax=Catellatospora sp. KI3 TaxID=3041620 RepID=UPI0024823A08|nr:DUF2306 domain-containing protein [Catellatospora sp. KI3]MDI1463177.1 DUF2306 domain-containing protein [Catellatospora sp. KI3]